MKNILSALVLASVLFVSCKKEEAAVAPEANKEVSVFSDSYSGPVDTTSVPVAAATTTPAANGTPTMIATTQTATQTQTAPVPAPVKVGKGMNPSHGQPGHRCDIAVGAPLNSAPGKGNVQQVKPNSTTLSSANLTPGTVTSNGATITTTHNTTPSATPNAAPITPIVTAPGMNPPHGQEGHDCAVAVGAPLPKK